MTTQFNKDRKYITYVAVKKTNVINCQNYLLSHVVGYVRGTPSEGKKGYCFV